MAIKNFLGSNVWLFVTLVLASAAIVIPMLWFLAWAVRSAAKDFWAYYKDKRDEPFTILKK